MGHLPLEFLACPNCNGVLVKSDGGLSCIRCSSAFAITDGIPVLLPSAVSAAATADRIHTHVRHEPPAFRRHGEDAAVKAVEIEAARSQAMESKRFYASPWHHHYARVANTAILSAVDARLSGPVLDYGCGVGVLLPDLCARYDGVIAMDISIESVMLAKPAATTAHFVVGDGSRLPFASDQFELVFSRGTLHHLPDLSEALSEIRRVLGPDGVLVLAEPSGDTAVVRGGRRVLSARDELYFRAPILLHALEDAGFRPFRVLRFGYLSFAFTYLLRHRLAKLSVPAWLVRSGICILLAMDWVAARIPYLRSCNLMVIVAARRVDAGKVQTNMGRSAWR